MVANDRETRMGNVRKRRRKVCMLCADKTNVLDYKDISRLRKFISDRGKILPGRASGCCAKHQRVVAQAIKRARNIGLVPFTLE